MLNNMRRLHPRGAVNPGLCVDAEGAMLGTEWILVQRTLKGFRALERDDAAVLQKSVLSEAKDSDWLFRQCERIADALNRSEIALAQIYGLYIPIPGSDEGALQRVASARLAKTGFDPDELRVPKGDPHGGEWTTGLDGGAVSSETPTPDTATTADAASDDSGGGEDTGDGAPNSGEDAGTPPFDFRIVSPDGPGEASPAGAPENPSTPAIPDSLLDVPQAGRGTQLAPALMAFVGSEAEWLATLTPAAASALRQMLLRMGGASFTLGFLFIPTNRSPIVEGPIANVPGASFRFDSDMGILQLRQVIGSLGPAIVSEGHVGTDGLFRDAQGHVIGRYLSGSGVIIDAGALPGFRMLPHGATAPDADTGQESRPKLCPDETPEDITRRSDRALAYQEQISGLGRGLQVMLNGVSFDGCRDEDGTMLEAKGPGFANKMLSSDLWPEWYRAVKEIKDQMKRQSDAAAGREVEWHFAEKSVADFFRAFATENKLKNIVVIYTPARRP